MENQDYVQSFLKLGKFLYYYAFLFVVELIGRIFWGYLPDIITLTNNSALNQFYVQVHPYISLIFLITDVGSFALMAIIVARVKSLEKLSIGGINIRLFPKFFFGFVLSILGYLTNIIYFYIQPILNPLMDINSQFFLQLSLKELIHAVFLIISIVFYFKTWNSLVDAYFTKQKFFTEYRIQKCQNAVRLLKFGFILSFIVYGIPVFTNLFAGIYFFSPIMGILYRVVGILNSTVQIIVDIVLLFGYMNLGGNFKALSAPKISEGIGKITEPKIGQNIVDSVVPTFCPQCGIKNSSESVFCASCGAKIDF